MRALAGAAAAAVALAAASARAADTPPIVVTSSVAPAVVLFGDTSLLEVQAVVDETRVDPSSVRLEADPAPFERVGGVRRDSSRSDGLSLVRFRAVVACADLACLARAPAALRVLARGRDGRRVEVRQAWPSLAVEGRVSEDALARRQLAIEDRPPAVRWRLGPDALASVLLAVAIVLAAAAAALLTTEVLALRGRRAAPDGTALSLALAELRRALRADEPSRRRAAGRLARVLHGADGRLARSAERLAWSTEPPRPEALETLAEQVERELA